MMKQILIAALIAPVVVFAAESFAASPADEGVKQTFAQLDRCVAKNDAKCIGNLLADDATYLAASGGAIIKGKAKIVETLAKLMGEPAPAMADAKQAHTLENLRAIGDDHALVDCAVAVKGAQPGGQYHTVALMVLQGGQWIFEDLRTYVVDTRSAAEKEPKTAPPGQMPSPAGAQATPPGPA